MHNSRRAVNVFILGSMVGAITRPLASVADVVTNQHASTDEVVDRWFGVRADGKTNDRAALQKAVDSAVGKTLVISGPCRLDGQGLHMRSNSHVRFMPEASLKLLPHDSRTTRPSGSGTCGMCFWKIRTSMAARN